MAQFTTPEKAAFRPARDNSEQPRGVGLSALALLALLVGSLLRELLELYRTISAAPSASRGATGFELLQIGSLFGIGALCIWHYWQGRSWARLLVLLWSFASVARALSFLSEHNLDPAALMARPLSFFQAVLGAVLLYWLNTSKVRAWYRKSSVHAGDLIADRLRGRLCTGVELDPNAGIWHLHFEHDAGLILRCPWRIVLDDNLAFAAAPEDDAPSPIHTARSAFSRAADPGRRIPGRRINDRQIKGRPRRSRPRALAARGAAPAGEPSRHGGAPCAAQLRSVRQL